MLRSYLRSRTAPWSGLIAGPAGWLVHHQGLGDAIYFDCRNGNPVAAVAVGCAALAIILLGGWLSWRSRGGEGVDTEPKTRRFLALVSVMACGLFGVTVLLQIIAGLILPGCFG